jgi:Caspase domain
MTKELSKSLVVALLIGLGSPLLMAQTNLTAATPKPPSPEPFLAEKKVAIVVGISDYPAESGFPKLQFAAKDAHDLASALEKQGYQTQLLTDQHAMKSSIRKALQQAHDVLNQGRVGSKDSGTILFAFSGHGGQKGTGVGARQYLVTYDSTADDAEPGYPLKEIAEALTDTGAARKMMFIDACRDLTATSSKGAPALSSFHELLQAQGMKIFFSTAPGQQSFEDEKSRNGYFTHYLLEGLSGKAATPDGLVTFDSLAKWVSHAMRSDANVYQVPYWNQNASGDFYVAGRLVNKEALVIGIDQYSGHPLHSAIAGAKQVDKQLNLDGFDTTFLENPSFSEFQARLAAFAKNIGPKDVAVFYFAGEGGIASGKPFLMAGDAKLPDQALAGKWEKPPANAVTLAEVLDIVRHNHPGPNIFLLDMGMARASSADVLDLASLKRDHTLVLFSCKSGQDPERTEDGSLFSRTVVSVLKEPNMSAGYAASKIMTAIFDQTNGVEYAIEIPMLPDRVYLTPSQ